MFRLSTDTVKLLLKIEFNILTTPLYTQIRVIYTFKPNNNIIINMY